MRDERCRISTTILQLATPAAAGAALLALAACGGASGEPPPAQEAPGEQPVVVAARTVCRIAADVAGAHATQVLGVDGAQSVTASGTTYWFFGDTLRTGPAGRRDVIAAAVATTSDTEARDCVDLTFKAERGVVAPMLPRQDETTAWPDGVLPLEDGSVLFYMVKAYRQSPFAWHVGSVGLGRVRPGTTDAERLSERIWDETSGFGARVSGARSPVRMGDDVAVFLRTDAGATYVARAPLDRLAEPSAYEYRAGEGWTRDPARATPIWPVESGGLPADNGVAVSFDERIARWVAVYNDRLAGVAVRTAPEPWGPWSEPVVWLDCRPLVGAQYPYCYSAELHRELTRDGGRTLYLTFSGQEPYDVTLVELHMGAAVHAWRDGAGALRYAFERPGDGYADEGIAFYASPDAVAGLAAVYEREDGDAYAYTLDAPAADARPAFYAYASEGTGAVRTAPVYRWRRNGREALHAREGWTRGEVAFYAPCVRSSIEDDGCR